MLEEGVGERSPPREGVRVGVGMLGGISSRSSNRDRFEAGAGGFLTGFAAVLGSSSLSLSSDELEEDVSEAGLTLGLGFAAALLGAGFASGFFFSSTFFGATAAATSASDSLEESEDSESDELESGLESTLSSPPPFVFAFSSSLS